MTRPSVSETYQQELAARGFQSDPAQLRAVQALERCANDWAAYKARRSNRFKKLINHPKRIRQTISVLATTTFGAGRH